jgi:multiple sugar transport system permease protein
VEVFRQAPMWRWALNTLMYSGLATLGLLVSSIPVAYALSCLRWRGRDAVFLIVLIALMLPPQVSVVPIYVMWAKLGNFLGIHFIGTLWPLIIPNWLGDAFSIFLLRQFFSPSPRSTSTRRGSTACGEFRLLTTVVVRLAKPGIAAVALFSLLYTFNDFFLPLLYTSESPHNWVLSIGLSEFRSLRQVQWNLTMARRARDGSGDHRLLPRAEGVRRGRDAHGGEGVKVAVIGAGSTYTPELVSGPLAPSAR